LEAKLKSLFLALIIALSTTANAASTYYPSEFVAKAESKSVRDQALKDEIYNLLTLGHIRDSKGGADKLGCELNTAGCQSHVNLGYDGARKVLFGKIHLKSNGNGYYIEDVYCNKKFGGDSQVGPNAIPNNNKINCEHTWPQSRFSSKFPKDLQKADLHHLYPTDSRANSIRGNLEFADVASDNGELSETNCNISKFGTSVISGGDFFEPPTHHKGNVARALFYFSVRYKITISKDEESFLRKWHEIDPVDQDEMNRNEIIYQVQKDRNPFIDFPELTNQISDF
jgi:deoxyribonuclease I